MQNTKCQYEKRQVKGIKVILKSKQKQRKIKRRDHVRRGIRNRSDVQGQSGSH